MAGAAPHDSPKPISGVFRVACGERALLRKERAVYGGLDERREGTMRIDK
jgi:hypothetical protein